MIQKRLMKFGVGEVWSVVESGLLLVMLGIL